MNDDLVNDKLRSTKAALDRVSPSLCLAKWSQATLHLHNGNTQSCHHVKSHSIDASEIASRPQALHNTVQKQVARREMLSGKRPSECTYCWTAEDRGRLSDRILKSSDYWSMPYMKEILESGEGHSIVPRYLEVSFDSTCNFRCMYCGPAYSSTWLKEIEQYGPYPTSLRFNSVEQLKINHVYPLSENRKQVYVDAFWRWWPELSEKLEDFRVTGGEPFLSPHTFSVLDWLLENPRPNMGFAINSNMGIGDRKMDRALELIGRLEGKVRQFTLFTSMDCVGPRAEYTRFGLDFARFVENTERLLSGTKWPINLAYMITVNALSVSGLKDLIALILDQRLRYPHHEIHFDTPYLQNPNFLSVDILPKGFAKYIDETTNFMRAHRSASEHKGFRDFEIVKVNRVRDFILTPRHSRMTRALLRRDFNIFIEEYDRRRGTDFARTFPEYAGFRDACRSWYKPSFLQELTL